MTSYPGRRTIHQILWRNVFLDSRLEYESLEGLMDFLAFLVQKLWQNQQKLIRGIPNTSLRREVDLDLYSFIIQARIQPNFEPQFWPFVRVMTSLQSNQKIA